MVEICASSSPCAVPGMPVSFLPQERSPPLLRKPLALPTPALASGMGLELTGPPTGHLGPSIPRICLNAPSGISILAPIPIYPAGAAAQPPDTQAINAQVRMPSPRVSLCITAIDIDPLVCLIEHFCTQGVEFSNLISSSQDIAMYRNSTNPSSQVSSKMTSASPASSACGPTACIGGRLRDLIDANR